MPCSASCPLYDLTGDLHWLEGAVGAADYTETWTYAWTFPVVTPWPKHPFNRYSISGQSIITIGGGADVYMAACSYTYYRLYLLTKDSHYRILPSSCIRTQGSPMTLTEAAVIVCPAWDMKAAISSPRK